MPPIDERATRHRDPHAWRERGKQTFRGVQEFTLHFAAYAGRPKGSFLDQVAAGNRATITAGEQERQKKSS